MARGCQKCGRSGYAQENDIPDLECVKCGSSRVIFEYRKKNYAFLCERCHERWMLTDILPNWSDLFPYSGLAAPGDPGWIAK